MIALVKFDLLATWPLEVHWDFQLLLTNKDQPTVSQQGTT